MSYLFKGWENKYELNVVRGKEEVGNSDDTWFVARLFFAGRKKKVNNVWNNAHWRTLDQENEVTRGERKEKIILLPDTGRWNNGELYYQYQWLTLRPRARGIYLFSRYTRDLATLARYRTSGTFTLAHTFSDLARAIDGDDTSLGILFPLLVSISFQIPFSFLFFFLWRKGYL